MTMPSIPADDQEQSRELLLPVSVPPVPATGSTDGDRIFNFDRASLGRYCDRYFGITGSMELVPNSASRDEIHPRGICSDLHQTHIDETAEAPDNGMVAEPSSNEILGLESYQREGRIHEIGTDISDENSRDLLFTGPFASTIPSQESHQSIGQAAEAQLSEYIKDHKSLTAADLFVDMSFMGEDGQSSKTERSWQPFCLRRDILLSLSVIFIVCMLVTATLYSFSQKNNGISVEDESRHYAWKYGPTAVLTMILYLWDKIDLSVRSLMPWQELQNGPKPAEVTLLLDYISPILTASLWRALRNHHWAVVLTLIGRLLLLLTIAASTALFILFPTEIDADNVALKVSTFDTTSFHLDKVGPSATDLFYGVSFGNLKGPLGTFPDACVPPPVLPPEDQRIPQDAKLQAKVHGLRLDTQCEAFKIDNYSQIADESGFTSWTFNITTPTCHIQGVTAATFYRSDDLRINGPGIEARASSYACNLPWSYYDIDRATMGDGPIANANISNTVWYDISNENRVLVTVTDVNPVDNETITLGHTTAVLCNPSYVLSNYTISYDGASQEARVDDVGTPESMTPKDLLGFPQGAVTLAVMRSAEQVITLDYSGRTEGTTLTKIDSFFGLLKLQSNVSSFNDLLEGQALLNSAQRVINGVAVQLACGLLSKSEHREDIRGSAFFTQNRLHVTELSTAIICSILGLLAVFSGCLAFLAPRNVVLSKPGSALSIVSSVDFASDTLALLRNLGHVRDETIQMAIGSYSFKCTRHRDQAKVIIETSTHPSAVNSISTAALKPEITWWRPLGSQDWFLCVSSVIPFILLGLLQLSQMESDKKNGFIEIKSLWDQVATSYIPSIVSISVGAMFASISAACTLFAPYSDLVKRSTKSSRSVAITYVTQTGPSLEYSSVRNKHFGLAFITLTHFISSALTIVVSGLYSPVDIAFHTDVLLERLDRFDISGNLTNANPNAGLITKLITYYDLDFPGLTYDSVALPSVAVDNGSSLQGIGNTTITSRVTGIRSDLNCITIPASLLNNAIYTPDILDRSTEIIRPEGMNASFSIKGALPASSICNNAGNSNATLDLHQSYSVRGSSTPTPFGGAEFIHWIQSFPNGSWEEIDSMSHGCPSIAIILGQVTAFPLSYHEEVEFEGGYSFGMHWKPADTDISLLLCWPKFEEIDVDVTFTWPSMELSHQSPPFLHESSSRLLSNPTTGKYDWRWDYTTSWILGSSGWESLSILNDTSSNGEHIQDGTSFDPFILAMINGKFKVPLEQILGEGNTQGLSQQARALWRRYMAQAISQNRRVGMTFNDKALVSNSTTASGNSTGPNTMDTNLQAESYPAKVDAVLAGPARRLKQNASSKVVLQVLLGFMSLSIVAMRSLMSFNKVLPHNPCSIAGTATLVIDGNIREKTMTTPERHPGTRKKNKGYPSLRSSGEVARDTHLDEAMFTMGWWEDAGIRKFGIIFAGYTP